MRSRAASTHGLLLVVALAAARMTLVETAGFQEAVVVSGDVSRLTIEDLADGGPAAGAIEISDSRILIPAGLQIDLPAATLPLSVLFAMAPPGCREVRESGLARADRCRADPTGGGLSSEVVDTTPRSGLAPKPDLRAPIAKATVSATRGADGRLTALAVALSKNIEYVWGAVSFISTEHGYFRVNGPFRRDEGGMLVRFNDPMGYHAVQSGVACGAEGNCSPDSRFHIDTARASVRFRRGNPACVSSDVVPGLCPESNRTLPPDDLVTAVPLRVGDHVKAAGAFEIAGGVRFFSAQALVVEASPGISR